MKLSIITINYNNKSGLQKTIDSVTCQTWHDFEWIVIDGGSTDGSKELIEQYQRFFAYWCSEPDKGVYNAMNKGIEKAKGEYLLFLNSGDCLHEITVLETVLSNTMEDDILYGSLNFVSSTGHKIIHYPEKLSLHYFFCYSIGHPSSFIRTSLLKKCGYREDLKIVSDWCKFIEWFREGKSFRRIQVVVSDFDTTGLSSSNETLIGQERTLVLEDIYGKENQQLIDESIKMQHLYDIVNEAGFIRILKNGGRRYTLLLQFILFLNKTIKGLSKK